MIHPYQLNSLSKIYHEEALQKAHVRHLAQRAKAQCRSRSEEQGHWLWLSKLAAAFGSS
jgi:hypothetical protein